LQNRLDKANQEGDGLKEEKVKMLQKIRDAEWGKDQEVKSLNKVLAKVKDEADSMKISSI
jgi:hypothetical protein